MDWLNTAEGAVATGAWRISETEIQRGNDHLTRPFVATVRGLLRNLLDNIAGRPIDTAERDALEPYQGQIIFNVDTATFENFNGASWVDFEPGGAPSGPAGGVLSGSYPNPDLNPAILGTPDGLATLDAMGKVPLSQLPTFTVTDVFVITNAADLTVNLPQPNGTLGAGAGDFAVVTSTGQLFILAADPNTVLANWIELLLLPPSGPAGGDLSDTYPNPSVATVGGVAAAVIATNLPTSDEKAALAGTDGLPSGANPYVTDTDPRNTDARTPTGPANGDLAGTYPDPSVASVGGLPAATIAANLPSADEKAALVGTVGPASGANPYVTDTDPRNTDARTPTGPAGGPDLTGTYPDPILTNTGVIAAAYGDAANVGSFTVDGKGRLTAAISVPINFPVTSVFGRVGAVAAQLGDYSSSLVTNTSGVTGATVTEALDNLLAAVVPKPPLFQNFDLSGLEANTGAAASNAVSGQAIYYPFTVPRTLTISALQTRVINVTGGSTWSLFLGVYNYDDATRAPSTRVFFGSALGIAAAADINITAFTGSPVLTPGRYFLAALQVLTAGAGNLRRVTPSALNNVAMGLVVDQFRLQLGLATLPVTATPIAFPAGTQAFWARALVALP